MLLAAARDHQIDLSASWMIGDSMADIEAGRKVGCRTVLVASGDGFPASKPDLVAASLLEGVQQVLVCQELAAGRQDNR
jgi:histidinol phosphatase-like enzyme